MTFTGGASKIVAWLLLIFNIFELIIVIFEIDVVRNVDRFCDV